MTDIAPIPSPSPNPPTNIPAVSRPGDNVFIVGILTAGAAIAGILVFLHLDGGEVEYKHKSHKVRFRLGRRTRSIDTSPPNESGQTEFDHNPDT